VISSSSGPVAVTILPSRNRGAEVWGVLYRIPRRLVERLDSAPPLLDRIHAAVLPDGLFKRVTVTVHEAYRGREITCITYMASATARNQLHLLPRDRQVIDASYAQHLLESAKKQKLPGDYILELTTLASPHKDVQPELFTSGTAIEQNTEPLPILLDKKRNLASTHAT